MYPNYASKSSAFTIEVTDICIEISYYSTSNPVSLSILKQHDTASFSGTAIQDQVTEYV